MCDYSLQHVASRPAKTEDELVVTKFNNSITRGFAAVGEPHVAVCLLPGTEIAFDANVEIEPSFGTRGFAAVGEPHVAVCLLPGTEIAFDANVEIEPSFGIGILPNKKTFQRLARFRQINTDKPTTHHDALEFPDGQVVLLTRLCE